MGGGPASVEHPGLSQGESTAAEADQAGAARVCPPDGVEYGGAAGRRGTSTSGRLGTISVSAESAASRPATPVSVKNPSLIRVRGSGEQRRKS
ncbi:hypothetical protein GCM10014719_17270 [Planomonospora parontospora subsp. antibiotica]|nr:hypothetical protein GCM10014719_17270 [Planomonospora parontospora subsp. antibiotica]GII16001.1 hypothetical protein Ppa05_27270 [Planomonospora parontospora subsp. antibiotica]